MQGTSGDSEGVTACGGMNGLLQVPIRQLLTKNSEEDFELRNSPACPPGLQEVLEDSVDWNGSRCALAHHPTSSL